jgi:hypothetical protein
MYSQAVTAITSASDAAGTSVTDREKLRRELVASALPRGKAPSVLNAIRMVPHERQPGLTPSNLAGMVAVNPEKGAPGACWEALRTLPINFPREDEPRVPDHWQVFRAAVAF